MRSRVTGGRFRVFVVIFVGFIAASVAASDSKDRVRDALESVRAQLRGEDERFEIWSEALLLEDVDEQLESDEPDPEALGTIINAIAAAERPIDPTRIKELRDALGAWLSQPRESDDDADADEDDDAEADDKDDSDGDEEDDDEEDEEEQPKSELPEEGAERVVEAVDSLKQWLKRGGRNYATWSDALVLDEIESAAEDPLEAKRAEVLKQYVRIIEECSRRDRSAYARLRRELQAWQAELRVPIDEDLAAAVRARKYQFPGVDGMRLSNARQRLQSTTDRLGQWLETSDEYESGWKEFLQWEKLQSSLKDSYTPMVSSLLTVQRQFNSGEPGLKIREFADVQDALNDYVEILRLNETRPERLAEARRDLENAKRQLDTFLDRASEKRKGLWREFLELENLEEQLEDSVPSGRELTKVLNQFKAEEDGLDHRKFVAVKDRLSKYLELLAVSSGPSATDNYALRVEKIARLIEQHLLDPSNDTVAALTRELQWLEATGLLPDLVSRIKSMNSRPNFFASLSGDLITRALQDRITDTQGINRMFEGSRVRGTASTIADVTARLVPSDNGIILDVNLNGSTVANSVAQQRRVFVRTTGTTQIQGGTRLYLGLSGVSATPASVMANTNQQVCNICINRRCTCGNRLIRRIASRKAEKSRPKAEYMQTSEAKETITDRINSQTQEMVGQANERLQKLWSRLSIPQKFMPELNLRSTDRKVLSKGKLTVGRFFTALSDPPDVGAESDVAVQVHQSAINNVLAEVLGGLKLNNDSMVKLLEQYNIPVPPELANPAAKSKSPTPADKDSDDEDEDEDEDEEEEEEEDYWSITFDRLQPATVTFTDGKLRISVRGQKFEQGDQEVNEPIEISANYRLRGNASKQLEAKRIGDLDIIFVNSPGRLKTRQLAYKTAIKKRMEMLFQRKISIDQLPSSQITTQLRSLILESVEATRGWLALAFDLSNVDLKSQLGMSMSGSTASSKPANATLPSYYTRSVPGTPASCNNCQPANNRRRRLFRRFRRR